MRVVIDTNVLVSALWSRNNRLAQIIELFISGAVVPCYCAEIMREYQDVLSRPKLAFRLAGADVSEIIERIKAGGMCVVVRPSSEPFADESDRVFFDVAKACEAILITGNKKHYPIEPFVMSPAEFLDSIEEGGQSV